MNIADGALLNETAWSALVGMSKKHAPTRLRPGARGRVNNRPLSTITITPAQKTRSPRVNICLLPPPSSTVAVIKHAVLRGTSLVRVKYSSAPLLRRRLDGLRHLREAPRVVPNQPPDLA